MTDINHREDLIKTALVSTDAYLGILEQAKKSKLATQITLFNFFHNLERAYASLQELGVEKEHDSYINKAIDEILTYKSYQVVESFTSFVETSSWNDQDIDEIVNDIQWEDIVDLYNEDELIYDPDAEEIEEKITPQNRIKKSMSMRRRNPQLSIARNLKLRRTSSIQVLKKRAVNAARRAVYKKLLMGRDRSTLSASEKDMIEKRMKNFKYMQATIAIKMLPKLKAIEQSRLAHRTNKR